MIARPQPQTRIWRLHQWGRCIATMRGAEIRKRRSPFSLRGCQSGGEYAIKGCDRV
jgi:hypothetical protein